MKLTKRKGFNFFRSYYDVYNELETKEDKADFMDALLDRQFLGVKPKNLKGMAKFAYISQTNSIDSQVKGYEDKTGVSLDADSDLTPTAPPTDGGNLPPTLQVQVEGKGKEKVQVKEKVNSLDVRKLKFSQSLEPFLIQYGKDFLNSFYFYWTEPNTSKTKMKFELQRTWDFNLRLKTWAKNETKFNQTPKNNATNRNQTTEESLRAFIND
jgi:hypothetical protein